MNITTVPGCYTTAEVAVRFSWTRQQVSATARREQWRTIKIGNTHLYITGDVDAYALARLRTRLARQAGLRTRGLIRSTELDVLCPTCSGFAVQVGQRYVCEHGHEGRWYPRSP